MNDGEAEVTTWVDACSEKEFVTEWARWWTERQLMAGWRQGSSSATEHMMISSRQLEGVRWTNPEVDSVPVAPWDRIARRQEAPPKATRGSRACEEGAPDPTSKCVGAPFAELCDWGSEHKATQHHAARKWRNCSKDPHRSTAGSR